MPMVRPMTAAAPGSSVFAGAFSFYPTKVMTSGEGGMIVTDDAHMAEEARIYRDHGKASFAQNLHVREGYNWRLSEPHAIIGLCHLRRLPGMLAGPQQVAAIYDQGLSSMSGITPLRVPEGGVCNYYKYIAPLERGRDRKALKAQLREQFGVALTGEVYEVPIQHQPVFKQYARYPLPVADDIYARHVCLPVFASMTGAQARRVVEALGSMLV